MTLQILVTLHKYPDGNSANIAAHAAAVARHLKAYVHGFVLDATFPPASSLIGNMLINIDSMVREVTAKCHARGAALVHAQRRTISRALQDDTRKIGADMMVMCAFGHSQIHYLGMGGATAGVPRDLKLPVLVSH